MWIKLAYKKEFVLSTRGSLFCISMIFTLFSGLILLNISTDINHYPQKNNHQVFNNQSVDNQGNRTSSIANNTN
jgi:hypothetical protein